LNKEYAIITIKVTIDVKKELEDLKIIPEETMNNLIKRLIENYKKKWFNVYTIYIQIELYVVYNVYT